MKRSIFLLLCISGIGAKAQTITDTIVKATEFSIPQSGAFTLLGNTPSEVTTPGFTKDINFNTFLNKFSLQPNIAFDIQPVWLFGFKNKNLEQYQKMTNLARFLSTASVSLGTLQINDSVNRFAYSLKLSFQHDPMNDTSYKNGIDKVLIAQRKGRANAVNMIIVHQRRLTNMRDTATVQKMSATDAATIIRLDKKLDSIKTELDKLQGERNEIDINFSKSLKDTVAAFAKSWIEENRTRPKMDIGFGQVYTYADPNVTNIKLNDRGFGFWANPSIGFIPGRLFKKDVDPKTADKILLTGIYKNIKTDSLTQQYYGGNLRYGSAFLNFFVEYIYSDEGSNTKKQTVAYGGSYTIGTKKLIEFGLRTDYDKSFKFLRLRPVISFNWELGKDLLK